MEVPNALLLPHVVRQSDLLALMPREMAELFVETYAIKYYKLTGRGATRSTSAANAAKSIWVSKARSGSPIRSNFCLRKSAANRSVLIALLGGFDVFAWLISVAQYNLLAKVDFTGHRARNGGFSRYPIVSDGMRVIHPRSLLRLNGDPIGTLSRIPQAHAIRASAS